MNTIKQTLAKEIFQLNQQTMQTLVQLSSDLEMPPFLNCNKRHPPEICKGNNYYKLVKVPLY